MKKLIANPIRVIRLLLGAAAIYYAFVSQDVLLGIAGGLFLLMGIFNAGCCMVGSCGIPNTSKRNKSHPAIKTYEEITSK